MRIRHFTLLMGLSALWGASFMFIRMASPALGPWVLAAGRLALGTLTLAVLMRWTKCHWPWHEWRPLAMLGAFTLAVPFLLFAWAALHLPAGYIALLNCTAVLFATLASAGCQEDTLTPRKWAGCVFGFAGVGLIVQLGPVPLNADTGLAALACVAAAACHGLATPLVKRATRRMEPLAIAAGLHASAFLVVVPGAMPRLPIAHWTLPTLAAMAVLGIVTSGLAYLAHLHVIQQVSPVAAMSPTFLIPLFGVFWGHHFLGEALSPGIYAGCALVLVAVALVTGLPTAWQAPSVKPAP